MLDDLPKSVAIILIFNSINCKYPYHKYLIEIDKLNNTKLDNDQIILRILKNIAKCINIGITNQYSLYDIKNIF